MDGNGAAIPLAMLVVFGSAKLLAEIFERLKQPPVAGEILAGVLIGPAVLGWIAPNQVLSALSDLGAMFLLFRIGQEVRPAELFGVGGIATATAIIGDGVAFFGAWAVMRFWGFGHYEAIFVAAAMVATSVGITAQVLRAKGVLKQRTSRIILAAAIIDDVLGLIVLAVVSGLREEHLNTLEILLTSAMALAFVLVVAVWGTRTVAQVIPRLRQRLAAGEVEFNLAMILLFGLAVLAIYAGVAAVTGAFLAGMALSGTARTRVRDLTHGVAELLVPFFLAGIGLNLDLGVLATPSILGLAAAVLAAAVISKLIGCGLAASSLGWLSMLRVGAGMVPRGEVGMVVAQLGLKLGIVSKPVYAVIVFTAFATTMITPPLIGVAFRGVPHEVHVEEFPLR